MVIKRRTVVCLFATAVVLSQCVLPAAASTQDSESSEQHNSASPKMADRMSVIDDSLAVSPWKDNPMARFIGWPSWAVDLYMALCGGAVYPGGFLTKEETFRVAARPCESPGQEKKCLDCSDYIIFEEEVIEISIPLITGQPYTPEDYEE